MPMERGMIFALVAIALLVCLCAGLVYGIVTAQNELEKIKGRIPQLEEELEQAKENMITAQTKAAAYAKLITGTEDVDPDRVKHDMMRDTVRDHISKMYEGLLGRKLPLRSDYTALEQVIKDLTDAALIVSQSFALWERTLDERAQEAARERENLREEKKAHRSRVDELDKKISDLQGRLREQMRRYEEEVKRLNDKIQQLRTRLEEERKKAKLEASELRSMISILRSRLRYVLAKKPKDYRWADPDGQVLKADMRSGLCWVDLGKRDRILPGMIFEIFRQGKGGQRVFKGRIEIRRVMEDISECSILEVNDPKEDPLVKGDYLLSPLYDKRRGKMRVVFIGDFKSPFYTRYQLTKKLRELNIVVERKVTPYTDYVILGANPENVEDYKKAEEWVIPFIREMDLIRFLRR